MRFLSARSIEEKAEMKAEEQKKEKKLLEIVGFEFYQKPEKKRGNHFMFRQILQAFLDEIHYWSDRDESANHYDYNVDPFPRLRLKLQKIRKMQAHS